MDLPILTPMSHTVLVFIHDIIYAAYVQLANLRKEVREDPKYQILLDRETMQQQIGQLISLPELPTLLPKGFQKSSRESFLLTQERYNLYEEIDKFVKKESTISQSAGFVPSGPHGIGKSGIGLLLASYGFVNKHVVVYIVSAF